MNELAPIVLFVYNRPLHTRRTIEALQKNKLAPESELIIFSDGAKNGQPWDDILEVRRYLRTITGFGEIKIFERDANWGLANSIIDGVTSVISNYGKAIVMEDDLLTSPYFLTFLNKALDFYSSFPAVFSISAYNHPSALMPFPRGYEDDVYCSPRNFSTGWGTWKDRWENVDWQVKDFAGLSKSISRIRAFNRGGEDLYGMLAAQRRGEIDSWAIRWTYAHFKSHAVSVCPVLSYINNIGHDGSGVHCGTSNRYANDLEKALSDPELLETLFVDERVMNSLRLVYRKRNFVNRLLCFAVRKLREVRQQIFRSSKSG